MLNNLNLKTKLFVLTMVPILGMLYFAQVEMRKAYNKRVESIQIAELAEFAVKASLLVHELQKERGMSAGYIGSLGSKFANKIQVQYGNTDAKIQALHEFLHNFDKTKFPKVFLIALETGLSDLELISKKRTRVISLTLGLKNTLSYYTILNGEFLTLAGEMAKESSFGNLTRLSSGYVNFLQSKERAGIERAVLANTFAADQFGPGMFNKFLNLETIQKVYMDVFYTFAPAEQIAFYEKTFQGPAITETQRMRSIAKAKASTGGFNIDPAFWFKMQTQKINLLKQVEDKLDRDLIDTARTNARDANMAFIVSLTLFIMVFLLSVGLVYCFIRGILQQLGADPLKLLDAVTAIAKGDLERQLKSGEKQETGVFAGIKVMQKNLLRRQQADRQAAMEIGRIKQGLDNVTSNVMLADAEYKIVYMNDAIKEMFKQAEDDIKQIFPTFDSGQLLGTCIDDFHKDPSHQRRLLDNLSSTFRSSLLIGSRHLDIVANPVVSDNGERLGIVVEWLDRTSEVKIENEIAAIVDSVKAGQLHNRIDLEDKNGFFAKLSRGINDFSEVIEAAFADISTSMSSISQGDLSNRMQGDYQGVYLQCKINLNASIDKLTEIIGNINSSANSIAVSSNEVSSGNNDLSRRAEQQASSLEETASSMEQLTSTVQNNADNAQQANKLTVNAKSSAEKGGDIVLLAVSAMQDITDSSNQIANIISVIDEIAFQTNLLALNASVEAARAGEQGRGFSVVATEVRNLAQRSAKAAKDSKELIENSMQKVAVGTEHVNDTGKALQDIVAAVTKVSDIVAEISSASSEQSQGISQVNKAISQIDEITQQNAALSEQTSAASVSMTEQTDKMNQLLSFFQSA